MDSMTGRDECFPVPCSSTASAACSFCSRGLPALARHRRRGAGRRRRGAARRRRAAQHSQRAQTLARRCWRPRLSSAPEHSTQDTHLNRLSRNWLVVSVASFCSGVAIVSVLLRLVAFRSTGASPLRFGYGGPACGYLVALSPVLPVKTEAMRRNVLKLRSCGGAIDSAYSPRTLRPTLSVSPYLSTQVRGRSTMAKKEVKDKTEKKSKGGSAAPLAAAEGGAQKKKRHTRSRHRAKSASGKPLTKQQVNQLLAWERRGQVRGAAATAAEARVPRARRELVSNSL